MPSYQWAPLLAIQQCFMWMMQREVHLGGVLQDKGKDLAPKADFET